MKMLLVGVGGVGESIIRILKERDPKGEWLSKAVLADWDLEKAQKAAEGLGNAARFIPERVDARDKSALVALIKKHGLDYVMDAAAPFVTNTIFDAAFEADCDYMNMGTWSVPLEEGLGYKEFMSDYNWSRHEEWKKKGRLAVLGLGIDPGVVDVYARFAEKHLFDQIDEIHVKDGNNLQIPGMDIAFGFNVWTVLDEVMNPNVEYREGKFIFEPPFAGRETYDFPEGVGIQSLVKVEHEETVFMPRYIKGLKRCTFKIVLDDALINALTVIDKMNLRSLDKVSIGGTEIVPRDVVAAVAPQPTDIGWQMTGKMCVGIDVTGKKDGKTRNIFMYQTLDNQDAMKRYGLQAVVVQTGFGAAIGLELIGRGIWKGVTGVHAPEAFEPEPYLKLMEEYNFPYGISEKDSEYKREMDKKILDGILKK